jgi:hypothetical protein
MIWVLSEIEVVDGGRFRSLRCDWARYGKVVLRITLRIFKIVNDEILTPPKRMFALQL